MRFYIDHQRILGTTFRVDLTGNVKENAKLISTLFPNDTVIVWGAECRSRLLLLNGEIIKDNDDYEEFFTGSIEGEEHFNQLCHEWKNCIVD